MHVQGCEAPHEVPLPALLPALKDSTEDGPGGRGDPLEPGWPHNSEMTQTRVHMLALYFQG